MPGGLIIFGTANGVLGGWTVNTSVEFCLIQNNDKWQSGDYYLFPPPEISGGQSSERVKGVSNVILSELKGLTSR